MKLEGQGKVFDGDDEVSWLLLLIRRLQLADIPLIAIALPDLHLLWRNTAIGQYYLMVVSECAVSNCWAAAFSCGSVCRQG